MTNSVERMLPVYEAKMMHQFDHRWASYGAGSGDVELVSLSQKLDPEFQVLPRYWVREELVAESLGSDVRSSMTGWRDICRSTDERTMIAAELPVSGVVHTLPLACSPTDLRPLLAQWNSFVLDYVARQKVGGTHMTYSYLKQLPAVHTAKLGFTNESFGKWVSNRVAALSSPNGWDAPSRGAVRAELDAACFHLYGVERDDVDYIMETFPIVKRKEVAEFGEFRTKRMILEAYDAMAEAVETGAPYASPFDIEAEVDADA